MSTTWKMSPRDKARAAAKRFWNSLDHADRNRLGDEFVLGTFDWSEWFDRKPAAGVLSEVDRLRIDWEIREE
jgi:hypothetical protein